MVYIDVSLFLNQKEHFVKTQNVMSNKRKRNVHFSFFVVQQMQENCV